MSPTLTLSPAQDSGSFLHPPPPPSRSPISIASNFATQSHEEQERDEGEGPVFEPLDVEELEEDDTSLLPYAPPVRRISVSGSEFMGFESDATRASAARHRCHGAEPTKTHEPTRAEQAAEDAGWLTAIHKIVQLSRTSVDLGRDLLQTMAGIAASTATLAQHHTDSMDRLIRAVEHNTQSAEAMRQAMASGQVVQAPNPTPSRQTNPEEPEMPVPSVMPLPSHQDGYICIDLAVLLHNLHKQRQGGAGLREAILKAGQRRGR
uniref:uncharacterized protein n=1 Tax=Pristiophorus japonicus TaxID=55135 RepID=UPI00398EAAAD